MNSIIVIFSFKRPDHLKQTLIALANNHGANKSHIVIYCDGPRNISDTESVMATRAIARSCSGFAEVEIICRDSNYGLSRSIISGVSEQLEKHEQVIVLEDDMVTSPYFLQYMNHALEIYRQDERVISIHGYMFPIPESLPETFFLRGADCWGWATWRRGWHCFNPDGSYLLRELKKKGLLSEFDLDGAYPFSTMLKDQINGVNDSWAIRWHASAFLNNALTLYPSRSLVHNIGNDDSGTHSKKTKNYDVSVSPTPIQLNRIPIQPSNFALSVLKRHFHQISASNRHKNFGLKQIDKVLHFLKSR